MSLTRKVAYNTIIQIIGKVITTVISLVLIGYLTRYLGVAGFGAYTTIFAYVSFWAVFADFGFFTIMVRELSKPQADTAKIFNNIMTLRAMLGIIVFSLAFIAALFIPNYSLVIKLGIGLCALGWFWMTLNSTYVGVFQSNLKMDRAVITDILGRIVILGLVILFIKLDYGLVAIMAAYLAGNLVNFLASMILGLRWVKLKLAFDFNFWRKIFWETLPMGVIVVLGVVYFKMDTVLLSLLKTPTDVGIYGPAFKILEIMLLLPGMFMGNVFPIITRYIAAKDHRLALAIQKAFDFMIIATFPVVVGILLLAKPIITFIAGIDFVETSTINPIFGRIASAPMVLEILALAIGLNYMNSVFSYLVVASGKQKKLVIPYIVFVIVNLILNLILIPRLSYIGAAVSTVITALLVFILTCRIAYKSIDNLSIKIAIVFKSLLSSLIMGAVIYYTINLHLLIIISIAFITYFLALYLLRGISREQIMSVMRSS